MLLRFLAAAVCAAPLAFPTASPAQIAPISGCVTRADGSGIPAASVSTGAARATTVADARGCYVLNVDTDSAVVSFYAMGFQAVVRTGVRAGSRLDVTLIAQTSSLVTIGRVDVNRSGGVSTSSAPSVTLDAQRAAQNGYVSVGDMLASELSLTDIRPAGGGTTAPHIFALRGPDPTETLIDVDGHEVNNGNTGDFDLSLLDPQTFQSVELVYGIAPSSLVGPNTIGGAINLRTLEPTQTPHGLARFSAGNYGSFGATLQGTGTSGRVGYAVSLHRLTTDNEPNGRTIAIATDDPNAFATASVGSGESANSALAKVRYAFGDRAGGGFVQFSLRDQSSLRDESAALSSLQPDGTFHSFAGSFVEAHDTGYGMDAHVPLGRRDALGNTPASLTFRHFSSTANQSVFGPVADSTSAYFFNDRGAIGDDTVEFDRQGRTTLFSLKGGLRTESLSEPFSALSGAKSTDQSEVRRPSSFALNAGGATPSNAPATGTLAQTQRSIVARYAFDAAPQLHATLASYYSNFSSFGTSFDPRVGLVWTPTPRTAVRTSFGTTFQSPQLSELFVPNPLPAAGDTLVHIGNPALKADHATEYDLGADQVAGIAGKEVAFSFDLYRTNLRAPSQTFIPQSGTGYSYPINVGGAVYRGFELRAARTVAPGTQLRVGYSVDSAFATSVPPGVGGGSLVTGAQFSGVPLRRGTFELTKEAPRGLSFQFGGAYESSNNELNEPAFVTFHAAAGYSAGDYRLDVAAQNLTNVYAFGFTRAGAGVPYAGAGGPIPLNAYALPATRLTVSLTRRF